MNEKQLARYLRAVRRRLSLSGQMKDRVMDDLRSSINERREAGQTDAEIFAALGPAKQAAAELTAQLPGYAFRKSPLRFVCLGAAVLALLAGLLKTVTNLRGFASVGVIGGADGPTALVAGSGPEGSRGVCSALHFEPVQDDVEWCVEFLAQPFAGAVIPLL